MPRPVHRPLALLICSMFAGMQVTHAAIETATMPLRLPAPADSTPETPPTAHLELAALNDKPVRLRVERKFNVLGKKAPGAESGIGLSNPVQLKKDDSYPTFIIADHIEGRTDDISDASGNVELRKSGTLLLADKLTYWPLEDEVDASGNVVLQQAGMEVATPHLRMKLSEQIGFAEQADYRIAKLAESKLYESKKLKITLASSNTTVSGAPMMLNIPNSYGLPTMAPPPRPTEAGGHAERIDFEGENQIRLEDATYSTCKPGAVDWYLKSAETHLDYDEDSGLAKHASLWFKEVPLFYSPIATFPINNQRHSGALSPTFSASTRNGFDFTAPYYWNVAPNYDLTLFPRYMSKRGFQLGAEARYLDYNYRGDTKFEYLPNDEMANRERYAYRIQHQQILGRGASAVINWNGVSDDYYWQDLSSRLLSTSQVQLPKQVIVGYSPNNWLQTTTQVLRYQTLQTDPKNLIARPYFLEPQINIIGYKPNILKTDLSLLGQYTRFSHPSQVEGERMVLYPQVSLPIIHPAFQITPKLGVHMTKYSLNNRSLGEPTSISRTLPTFSLDSTVVFEREARLLDLDYIQTLEPRLYYVHIPYKDQSQIPVFDTGLTDFNFAQIFAENRYSGFDRINDANQLTAALTSRMLDANTGVERFRAMVGQRYYFKPQQAKLPYETARTDNFSSLIVGATGLILPKTYGEATWEYNYRENQTERLSLGMRYQPDYGKVLSASYRYTRDQLTGLSAVDQIDLAGQWPLDARWYAVGRYNYSTKDRRPLETIAGLEYNAGCWATRLVVQRLEATAGSPNTTVFFQLELNDFGSLGSNPIHLLRRTIPGYGKTNELSTGGSLLTTE